MTNGILFAICVLLWSSTWYAIKLQLGHVPIEWSVAYRFALAASLLLGWCQLTKRRLRFQASDHLVFAGLGALLFSINYMFVYWGTGYLTSGLVAVVFSMISLANQINGALLLKQKIEAKVLFGAILGLSGLVLIFLPEFKELSFESDIVFGIAVCLAGTFCASLGNTLAATERAKAFPLFAFNGYSMLYGAILMAVYALILGKAPTFDTSTQYVGSLVFLSVFGTVAAFTIYLTLLKSLGLGRSAYVAVIVPIVALLISTVLEGYRWTTLAGMGAILVLAGNLLIVRRKKPAVQQEKAESTSPA